MADDSARQAHVQTACWGLRATTGQCGCTIVMVMMTGTF